MSENQTLFAGKIHFPPKISITSLRKSRSKQRIGWMWFEEQFSIDHPKFLRDLAVSFPLLSPTELQVCAMLRASLLSKQIAEVLSISERSVENHRCNIRRKLSLESQQNLKSFLFAV